MRATELLQGWPDRGPEREAEILKAIADGHYLPIEWRPVTVERHGHRARFWIAKDALRVGDEHDSVRVNVTALTAQRLADRLSASLPTTVMLDEVARQCTVQVEPCIQPPGRDSRLKAGLSPHMDDLGAMVTHSHRVDKAVQALAQAPFVICNVGKHWVLSNRLTSKPNAAANYGWYSKSAPYVSASGMRMWQTLGTAHNTSHCDYCLDPDTMVLRADLRWVRICDLRPGEEVVGFDESLVGTGCRVPRLIRSLVLSTSNLKRICFEVVTSKGTVIASAEHRWPVYGAARTVYHGVMSNGPLAGKNYVNYVKRMGWVETAGLAVGDRIPYFCDVWQQDASWDGAWMAGFLDGEGWVSGTGAGFGQNPGALLNRSLDILTRNGLRYSLCPNKNGCVRVGICGQRGGLRLLGTFRPIRLMLKADQAWEGRATWSGGRHRKDDVLSAEVLEVREVGVRDVVGVGTSSGTLIANGLYTHNSQVFQPVRGMVELDGVVLPLAEVLTHPEFWVVLSDEGPLKVTRVPGVPLDDSPPPSNVSQTFPPEELPTTPDLPEHLVSLYLEARNYTKADRSKEIRLVVLHTAEIAETLTSAEALARWCNGSGAPRASWHFAVDPDSITQSVKEEYVAWHAPGANRTGIGIEMCGRAAQTPEQWEDDYSHAVLRRTARLVAALCRRWNLPVQFVDAAALKYNVRGITTHAEVTKAFKKSTHTDPGKHFPMDEFLRLVREQG